MCDTAEDIPDWAIQMAPCLKESVFSQEARALVLAGINVGESSAAALAKVLATYNLCFTFRRLERDFENDPIPPFARSLSLNAELLLNLSCSLPETLHSLPKAIDSSVSAITADHYGELFKEFDEDSYFDEPVQLLTQRFERNGFDIAWLQGKRGLDSGCGNGRYSVALNKLGLSEIHGLDMSDKNIEDAEKRRASRDLSGITYRKGDVLNLPYEDTSFDFVFSNGVLHHTTDWKRGVSELLRVLKPGGRGFFMVMPDPGGLHWELVELCRVLLHDIPHEFCHAVFDLLNVPKNLKFLYLDHILVPINVRLTDKDCRQTLTQAGASNIRRFERGADVDGQEALYSGNIYAKTLFGVGIHRYVFDKSL